VNIKKRALRMKEPTVEQPADNDTTRPKNLSASTVPSEGYVLEIDGKFKSEFETSEVAMKSALELKKKYPQIQVNVRRKSACANTGRANREISQFRWSCLMADFTWSTEHRSFCLPDRIADLAARPNRGPMSALGQKQSFDRSVFGRSAQSYLW